MLMKPLPTVLEQGAALRRRELTCVELVEDALSRRNAAWGAYRSVDDGGSLAQAEAVDRALAAGVDLGPWMGIPVSVKDLFGVSGYPTFAGGPHRLPAAWEQPGPIVRALQRQMAIVVGKTHTVEFAFGGLGTNPHTPTPRNPWDPMQHRVPGGSSSGAGVSLCEGSASLALGTDTAGSVRIPASYTGNLALKTSHGRWSRTGIVPLSPTLDSVGVLTRTVDDLVLAYTTLEDRWSGLDHFRIGVPPVRLEGLRLGRCDALLWDDCSAGVVEAVDDVLAHLERDGVRTHAFEMPEVELAYGLFRQGGPVSAELYHFLSTQLPDSIATLDPNVRQRTETGATLTAVEYLDRLSRLRRWQEAAKTRMAGLDAWVAPTVAITPPTLEEVSGDGYAPRNLLALRNTSVVNYLGMCAVTLPIGFDAAGMPVGMMLAARHGDDDRLVAIACLLAPYVQRTQGTAPPSVPFR